MLLGPLVVARLDCWTGPGRPSRRHEELTGTCCHRQTTGVRTLTSEVGVLVQFARVAVTMP